MCTMVVARRVVPGFPIVVAHNRDEFLHRPFSPPEFRQHPRAHLMPVDLVGTGTWFGVNETGLVVTVTNRFGFQNQPERRSRGLLCTDALSAGSVQQAVEQTATHLQSTRYNAFNLILASRDDAAMGTYDDVSGWRTQPLEQGIHVISSLGDKNPPELEAARRALWEHAGSAEDFEGFLARWLAQHHPRQERAVCKHLHGYGTVCSMQVWLGDDVHTSRCLYTGDAPCKHPAVPVEVPFFNAAI